MRICVLLCELVLWTILSIVLLCCSQKSRVSSELVFVSNIILVNLKDASNVELANAISFFHDKQVAVIAVNRSIKHMDIGDSLLISVIAKFKPTLVMSYNPDYPDERILLRHVDSGPALFYQNRKGEVESFSFLYRDENVGLSETFYLKVLQKVRPSLYEKFRNDSSIYKIDYIGNRVSFPTVHYADLSHTIDSAWINKIVIMGSLGDHTYSILNVSDSINVFRTPIISRDISGGNANMYGTVIVANILFNLLNTH